MSQGFYIPPLPFEVFWLGFSQTLQKKKKKRQQTIAESEQALIRVIMLTYLQV